LSAAQAQIVDINFPGKLIYVRAAPEPARGQVVTLTLKGEQIFTIPQESCAGVSQRGSYIALSSNSGTDLIVYELLSASIVMQSAWDSRWMMCFFDWIDDTTIRLHDKETDTKSYQLDVLTGEMSEYNYALQTYVPPMYPQLPNWYPGTQILPSPTGNLVLYHRCDGEIETYPDHVNCASVNSSASRTNWIIYDARQRQVLETLKNDPDSSPDFYYYLPGGQASFTWDGTSWSPNGRYLAYIKMSGFLLQIYDTIDQEYLDTSFVGADIDKSQ
jgi:hypothetical protein